ncbi:hypothetical protein JCM10450v2_006153 [Rhodotorula kratochvilovae]
MSHTPLPAPPPPGAPPSSPPVLKAILIGDASTGKTSLRARFVAGTYSPAYRATIGCDFLSRRMEVEGEEEVGMQVWDTAGQERFRSLAPAFYRASDACILVYSLASPSAPSAVAASIKSWFADFREKCPVSPNDDDEARRFCWVCVGAKADEADPHRAGEISDAVDEALQELLPRRKGGAAAARRASRTDERPLPTVSVEVLPPPTAAAAASKRRRVPRAVVDDQAGEAVSSGGAGAPPSMSSSAAASAEDLSASASTASTAPATPLAFELDDPAPDLLIATSPPAAPAHFGAAGAPPAIWEGGPFQAEGELLEREEEVELGVEVDAGQEGEEELGEDRSEAERFADEGVRHFRRTSAKTGEGVDEVFDYVARRVLASRAVEGLTDDSEHAGTRYRRPPHGAGRRTKPEDVIRVNEHTQRSLGQKMRSPCCS